MIGTHFDDEDLETHVVRHWSEAGGTSADHNAINARNIGLMLRDWKWTLLSNIERVNGVREDSDEETVQSEAVPAWRMGIDRALKDFRAVAELAFEPIRDEDLTCEYHPAPHTPPKNLPRGMMGVYCFWGDGEWLKIGKVGPKSQARYTSQHYGFSAPSTLAKSLAKDEAMLGVSGFDSESPGEWIKSSTHRVNILIPAARGRAVLSLLEAFLHARLGPRYEG